ncbi:MAG: MFS transporter [Pseudomonadota bacterium]
MVLSFYRRNAWWLGTGMLLTFASSFGQTFFIALFAGGIRAEFGLSNGEWGGLYTIGTIASALLIFQTGRFADTVPLKRLAIIVLLAFAASALLMMGAKHVAVLALAIFGLRYCGQGMMGLLAMTAVARWFAANRGRAVAVAFIGFPLGEAVFPFLAVEAQGFLGWRGVWLAVAVFLVLVILPVAHILLRHGRTPVGEGAGEEAVGMGGRHWTRRDVAGHWSFYVLIPGILAAPFIGTCAFFHQVHIAEVRGFDLATMALAFPVYAAFSVTTSILAGSLVDRVGPTRILPFFLLPLAGAISLLSLPGGVWIWFAVLMGTGVSQGVVMTLMGALWPTLYGTRWIGSVKSIFSALMVFATAAGPGVTGWVIDLGINFPEQALTMSAYCLAISVAYFFVAPRLTAALGRPAPQAA